MVKFSDINFYRLIVTGVSMSAQTKASFKGVVQTPDAENIKPTSKPKKHGHIFPIEWPPYDTVCILYQRCSKCTNLNHLSMM